MLYLAIVAFILALASSVQATTFVSDCQSDDYRTQQADIVIIGTVKSIGDGYAVVAVDSYEKQGGYTKRSEIKVQNQNSASGGIIAGYPVFTEADVGKQYRMQLYIPRSMLPWGEPYDYEFVCGSFGLQEYSSPTEQPPFPTETPEKKEYALRLKAGWNLVSVPVANFQEVVCVRAPCYQPMPANLKKNTCGRDTKVFVYDLDNKRYVDQTNRLYEKIYPGGGFDAGKSYWVKVGPTSSAGCEMVFEGTHEMTPALLSQGEGWALSAGWNNIGAPINNIEFSKISSDCRITSGPWKYNTAARKWEKAEVLKPGEGYFVKAASECTLAPKEPTPAELETIEINTVQCMGNPWEQDWLKTHDAEQYPPKQSEEAKQIIKAYYEKLGFTVYSVDFKKIADVVCLACSCTEGYVVVLTVARADAEAYCVQDSDCVRQFSCADCGVGTYVNKNYYREASCVGPRPSCPVQSSKGVCENYKCEAVAVEGG